MPASARAERVSATLLFLFSVLVIFGALALPYWTANAPGPGFVPFWLGVMLIFLFALRLGWLPALAIALPVQGDTIVIDFGGRLRGALMLVVDPTHWSVVSTRGMVSASRYSTSS